MVIPLKKSTASQEVFLGKFVDSTDGNSQETGLTINSVDIFLWKQGATSRVNPAAGATHMSQGDYYWVADDTDTNTDGALIISCHPSGALAVKQECLVYPANVYDSLFGTDKLQVDVSQVNGTAQTAGDNTVTINSIYAVVDTEVADIHTDVASITTSINSIYIQTVGTTIADSIWDEVMEGTTSARKQMNINHAVLSGKSDGGGTNTGHYRDAADSKNRVTVTMDAEGNRIAITTDGT
jgi:hypothetical protein